MKKSLKLYQPSTQKASISFLSKNPTKSHENYDFNRKADFTTELSKINFVGGKIQQSHNSIIEKTTDVHIKSLFFFITVIKK